MNDNYQAVAAFDLDGTLLNDEKKISQPDLETLKKLGDRQILRVVATGRNHHSVYRVLDATSPVDYVLFSSGAGIMNWKTGEILFTQHLDAEMIQKVLQLIEPLHLTFTIHKPIPDTHTMFYFHNGNPLDDLWQYANYYHPVTDTSQFESAFIRSTQMIIQFNERHQLFDDCQAQMHFVKTIHATSPINHQSRWMEVFHPAVSKANALQWLIHYLNLNNPLTFGIGNDFNDIDLLNYTHQSFVVENANPILKNQYSNTASNNNHGFTQAIHQVFGF